MAEMAAAFLCSHAGIENTTIDSSAAYISNWWSRLSEDRKLLIHSAAAAQKATDYILEEAADQNLSPAQRADASMPDPRLQS